MSSLKNQMDEPIHQRNIKIETFRTRNQHIVVQGTLIDNRLIRTYHLSGEERPASTIHHMVIRLLVDEKLTIQAVESEMPTYPHPECPETRPDLEKLVGMPIARGFTMKLKAMFEKGTGCSHLTELIRAMAPAAVQGFFTARSRKQRDNVSIENMKNLLVDTCWVWRKDGPAMRRLEK